MALFCIKCGVVGLTSIKKADLDHEYNGFQWWMQFGIDRDILSQHKRAKGYFYKKQKIKHKDYPLIIPYKQVWFRKRSTKLTPYWIKISVRKRKGIGIWLPIVPHRELPRQRYLRDSLLLKNHKGNYELRLIYDVPKKLIKAMNILSVDLGEKVIATVRGSCGHREFLGKKVRGIRRHYAWLRRRLGQKKLLKKIKALGQKETNKVNNELHHISKRIVDLAEKNKSIVVMGNLKGIRKSAKSKGKRMRRILGSMPYYRLTQMIQYKALQRGIQVFQVSEKYSSQQCHRCGNISKKNRRSQGLFVCSSCGLQYNADLNGATNILKRAGEHGFLAGALACAHKPITELAST